MKNIIKKAGIISSKRKNNTIANPLVIYYFNASFLGTFPLISQIVKAKIKILENRIKQNTKRTKQIFFFIIFLKSFSNKYLILCISFTDITISPIETIKLNNASSRSSLLTFILKKSGNTNNTTLAPILINIAKAVNMFIFK